MYRSVYDLKEFYNTRQGRVVRRVLAHRIRNLWPDTHGLRVMGVGYATPYLRGFIEESERVFSVMSAQQGAHHWPQDEARNLVCLSAEDALPIETNSVDRVIMVHSLEFSDMLQPALHEVWRVLKSSGTLLVVVPNRAGFWARADWTPFGHGAPYNVMQIRLLLKEHLFVHEQTHSALYMPPWPRSASFMKSAQWIEQFGQKFLPFGAGVYLVEATKQLYARPGPSQGSKVAASYVQKPAIQGMNRKAY